MSRSVRQRLCCAAGILFFGCGGGNGPGGNPLDLPLVMESHGIATYAGSFTGPSALYDNDGGGSGGLSVSEDGQTLYIASFFGSIGAMTVEATGGTAELVQAWTNTPDTVASAGNVHCETLEVSGSLLVTKMGEYHTEAQPEFIQRGDPGGSGFSDLDDIAGVDNARRLTQGLVRIPPAWQELLGGPVATLGSRLSIISNAQVGYGIATFDPSEVGTGTVTVHPLLDYTYGNPLEAPDSSHPDWDSAPKNALGGTDLVSSTNAPLGTAFIPTGSRSLLFVTVHGYGLSDVGCRAGSSVHNGPYRMQVVAYDLRDLVAVLSGEALPSDPRPYAWWEFSHPWGDCVGDGNSGSFPGAMAYDYGSQTLYGTLHFNGGSPDVHVWNVAAF